MCALDFDTIQRGLIFCIYIRRSGLRFFRNAQGQRIAYVDEGNGPILALPAWWVSHLDLESREPAYARFFAQLGSDRARCWSARRAPR